MCMSCIEGTFGFVVELCNMVYSSQKLAYLYFGNMLACLERSITFLPLSEKRS